MAGAQRGDTPSARLTPVLPAAHGPAQARDYLDIAGVLIVALDVQGRVTLLNRLGAQLLGRTEAEIVGEDWFSTCIPEVDRARVRLGFDRLMSGAQEPLEDYENRVISASGEVRLVAWQNIVLRDARGAPVGTLSSGTDVTERRRMEQELERYRATLEERVVQRTAALHDANELLETEIRQRRQAEEQLRALVEELRHAQSTTRALLDASVDMCALLDTEGTVLDANEPATELLGLPREEVVGKRLYDIFEEPHASTLCRRAAEVFRTGAPIQYPAQGETATFSVQVYPVAGPDTVDRVAVYVRDTTERSADELAPSRLRDEGPQTRKAPR